jgi:hypothetical protein
MFASFGSYMDATAWALPDRLAAKAQALEEETLEQFLDCELPLHGRKLWRRQAHNLITDEGARWVLNHTFVSAQTLTWYLLPKGAGAFANGDTMASHAGWSEIQAYSQTARPSLAIPTITSGRSGVANIVSITANASTTVAGIGLTTLNSKGGTTGTLLGGADFGSSQPLTNGQILRMTVTVSA